MSVGLAPQTSVSAPQIGGAPASVSSSIQSIQTAPKRKRSRSAVSAPVGGKKRRELSRIEKMSEKISATLASGGQLFQQSPINAGGYNPRSQHGSLGASHTIGKHADKTGRAVSGHVAVLRGNLPEYHRVLGERSAELLEPEYTPPTTRSNLRTQYIKLLRLGSRIIIAHLDKKRAANNDNNYPCVLVPFVLPPDIIEAVRGGGRLTAAEEKTQDAFTTLMGSYFAYFATRLGLTATTHRSSFAHPTVTVAPCDTHMRVSPGLTAPEELAVVAHAIELTCRVSEAMLRDPHFVTMMGLRESGANKAKSAIYNIVERNLSLAFYSRRGNGVFTLYRKDNLDNDKIRRVIEWVNGFVQGDLAEVPEAVESDDLKRYGERRAGFLEAYRLAFGVAKQVDSRRIPRHMQLIGQARMVQHSPKGGSDDVSDSEDETEVEVEVAPRRSVRLYHKKSGALNGMHCVHKIMSAICSRYPSTAKLFINYVVQKMYFETDAVFTKWVSLHEERRKQRTDLCSVRRRTEKQNQPKLGETQINVLFADVNHCNVSYRTQSEGIFSADLDLRRGTLGRAVYDYYIIDITSATPKEIRMCVESVLRLVNGAIIFTLSSDLKLGQLGADFYAHGGIRIFTTSKPTLNALHKAIRADDDAAFLVDQGPRRFMKRVGGALQFSDIFPGQGARSGAGGGGPSSTRTTSEADIAAAERAARANLLYDDYIRRNFVEFDNPGRGDCLYYAFSFGSIPSGADSSPDTSGADEAWQREATRAREEAAKATAILIARGAGLPPRLPEEFTWVAEALEDVRRQGWEQVRIQHGIQGDLPVHYQHEVESFVIDEMKRNAVLLDGLRRAAAFYQEDQSLTGTWAGDLEFRGLALAFRVDLHVHYVDASERGVQSNHGHRVDVYAYQELYAMYFFRVVPAASRTVHIIHKGGVHYVTGIPR